MLRDRGGFTIIEAMIFLVISSSMLVITVVLFGGYQRTTQFNQAVRDLESEFQDHFNDVVTGTFNENTSIKCSTSLSNPFPLIETVEPSSTSSQGNNFNCVYLGKLFHFQESWIDTYTIVGNRNATGGTFYEGYPKIVPSSIERINLRPNLKLNGIYEQNGDEDIQSKSAVLVFASTPNGTGLSSTGIGYNSGIQRINLYISGYSSTTIMGTSAQSDLEQFNNIIKSPDFSIKPSHSIYYCLQEDSLTVTKKYTRALIVDLNSNSSGVRLATDEEGVRCE